MLVRSVINHEIENHTHATAVTFLNDGLHIFNRAIRLVYSLVVANVIAHVDLRAFVHGRNPDDIYSEVFEVVNFGDNAWKITNPVIVRVFETRWIYLIDRAIFPPDWLIDRHIEILRNLRLD
jgi:hypothetical protein